MLTRKQHALLVFIDTFIKKNGWAPSYEEMRVALGHASKSSVHRLLTSLIERNFVARRLGHARSIQVIGMPSAAIAQSDTDVAEIRRVAISVVERNLWPKHVNRMPPTLAPAILDALDGAGLMLVRKP